MTLQRLSLVCLPVFLISAQEPRPEPEAQAAPPAQKRGLLTTKEGVNSGYTLLAPLRSNSTYLIDLSGKVVHEWKSDATPGHSVYLLPNGHLIRAEQVDSSVFQGGGQGGRLREFDWDGKIVWEYSCADATRLQHHDFKLLPNGHVLMIAWELVSADKTLAAGRIPNQTSGEEMWPDMLLEVEPTLPSGGKVVWEWHAFDHLIQDHDKAQANFGDVAAHPERVDVNADRKPATLSKEERDERDRLRGLGYGGGGDPEQGRGGPPDGDGGPGGPGGPTGRGGLRGGDWLHTNAVAYNASLDAIIVSVHNLNELWVIDHSTTSAQAKSSAGGRYGKGGDLLFRWGNPRMHRAGTANDQRLFGQHDPQWIPDGLSGAGHVLVFNNGDRGAHPSSVEELAISLTAESLRNGFDPKTGPKVEVAWSYKSPDISSGHISGSQRLPNGNTLICAGETGRLVEVNAKREVVWDFLSPLGGDAQMPGRRGGGGPPPGAGGPPPGAGPGGEGRPAGGGRRGPPGMGGRGPGDDGNSLFRAWRYAPDFPGLAKLNTTPATPTDEKK